MRIELVSASLLLSRPAGLAVFTLALRASLRSVAPSIPLRLLPSPVFHWFLLPLPLCFRKIPRSGSGKRSGNQFRFAPRMSPGVSSRADHFGFPQTRARAQPEAQTANIRRFLAKTPVFARTCRQAGFGHQSVFLLDRRSVKQTCLWHVCSVDLPSYAGQGNPGRGACLKENGGCIPHAATRRIPSSPSLGDKPNKELRPWRN